MVALVLLVSNLCFLGCICVFYDYSFGFMCVGVYMWCSYLVEGVGWVVKGYDRDIFVAIGGSVGLGSG